MEDAATRNIALLIDADNASHHAIDPVLTVLAELGAALLILMIVGILGLTAPMQM